MPKFLMTDPILGYPDEEGHAEPISQTEMFVVNPQMALPIPIGEDGKPIYLGDDNRTPRALTPRWEIYRILNVGINPAEQPVAEKVLFAEISAEVLSHREARFADGWVTTVLEQAGKKSDAVVLWRLTQLFNPPDPDTSDETDDTAVEAPAPKPKGRKAPKAAENGSGAVEALVDAVGHE